MFAHCTPQQVRIGLPRGELLGTPNRGWTNTPRGRENGENQADPTTGNQETAEGIPGSDRVLPEVYSPIRGDGFPVDGEDKTKGADTGSWDPQAEGVFRQIQQCFCEAPVCVLPDNKKPFVLRTDASDLGLGVILLQDQGQGMQPVACASKKLSPAEKNYPIIEKECLALVWGIQRFEQYLSRVEFAVQTDNFPLQYLDRINSTLSLIHI
eukprot:TRINITY_DN46797_c0_g1_i3.p1 TRINITY_DN46797_c0_g1~~TRINITY_DN46797_c0_g1_i3.p1  ORF type:complete len:210 (-),score=16.50 TRINITY_DN46797_c0_g1_i3:29-658(-)